MYSELTSSSSLGHLEPFYMQEQSLENETIFFFVLKGEHFEQFKTVI